MVMDRDTAGLFIPEKPASMARTGPTAADAVRLFDGAATFALSGYVVRCMASKDEPKKRTKGKK
jgi:hypothetical protein